MNNASDEAILLEALKECAAWIEGELNGRLDVEPLANVRNLIDNPPALPPLYMAAPELLAAANDALDALDNLTSEDFALGRDKEARERLRAAIAKAEAA